MGSFWGSGACTAILVSATLVGCIATDNVTVEGTGTPDITQCSSIPSVADGANFEPQSAIVHGSDGRSHPDLFYIAWAQLDDRTDLRFPAKGYDSVGYEDKLLVSRRDPEGEFNHWQVWPPLDDDCADTEKVRIHSFDVAPDGESLFLSMSREEEDNPDRNLGIYRLDIASQRLEKLSNDNSVDFLNPTYVGNDAETGHEMLLVAKTVYDDELPLNYRSVLVDEYDRAPTPLIHKMDTQTGDVTRIGFNNSHQTEPMVIDGPDGNNLVVFNQWEHQDTTNRFALWKMQIDGSDSFTFYGQEAATDQSSANIYAPRVIRSGPYKDYVLMGQGARTNHSFVAEGDIVMTKRVDLDLRSDRVYLQELIRDGEDQHISRTPEHYNDESFAYAYRANSDSAYAIYTKDYPATVGDVVVSDPGALVLANNDYHFMQPRSFYPPTSETVAPDEGSVGESRVSFTNENLAGRSGFLVQNIGQSDNGVQHQLDNIAPEDLSLQFYLPSHHFSHSKALGIKQSQEASIPASGFIKPEEDGSIGVVLKEGLYVWKVNKRFEYQDANGATSDVWLPVRAERQEISFVPNRVNACNQCHQDRNQANIDQYADYESIAAAKMQGDLSDVLNTYNDISDYDASESVPDFHADIVPLLAKPGLAEGNKSCMDCHNAQDKLNLSNSTGVSSFNTTYRNLVQGAHKLSDGSGTLGFLSDSINPLGMDDDYNPAPFLWSLLLNDDLTVPPEGDYANESSRALDREGDYGAAYSEVVESDIKAVNDQYDHSKHWSAEDVQTLITYSTTQLPVGMSDSISFRSDSISRTTNQAQKAYQSMVRNCYACHTSNSIDGIDDDGFGLPLYKRFVDNYLLRDTSTRFVVRRHLNEKTDETYSIYSWISNLTSSMSNTLWSASQRINFDDLDDSEILVFARGGLAATGVEGEFTNVVTPGHPALDVNSDDYLAIANWVKGVDVDNEPPTLQAPSEPIVIEEYADPDYLAELITWSDPDDDGTGSHEHAQAFINGSGTSTHSFNDTMLALEYQTLTSAKLKTYAILGDRGEQEFSFTVTDGLNGSVVQTLAVTVTSEYQVPRPVESLPDAYGFYTERATGALRKFTTAGNDELVGLIDNYDGTTWTTMYRRSDKGWLYFIEQDAQRIHVVDESNAEYLFSITLDHEPNKDQASHKQTNYLIWWREAEGEPGDIDYRAGELQGLLESKLSQNKNGDFFVGLGDGEMPESGTDKVVVPQYRTKLADGGNTVGVYVWKRATFMTKWNNTATDDEGLDRLNVLNLETGKAKPLASYGFEEKTLDGEVYAARDYLNVRAVVVAEDGAFYGFNKDLNADVEVFNFDPLEGVQSPITDVPEWMETLMNDPVSYATPFVVVSPR